MVAGLVKLAAAPKLDLGILKAKQDRLFSILKPMRRVIIAYSGGADSAYLAWAAHRVLGENALAVTADSASIPESHKSDAEAFARECGFRHEYIETREFDNPDYIKNDPNRCFHCKDELFTRLEIVARERGIEHIAYGVNVDDLGDYRPGPARRQTAPGQSAAGGRRIDQSRNPRVVAPHRLVHLGSSRGRVPQLAHPLRNSCDH